MAQPAPDQPTTRIEGPPPGLASGRFDVPRWAIGALGAAIALAAFGYLLARWRRARKAAP
ncbi:MAG TPA: hypothetical protein VFS00_21090 [Polyangiaceae bacterium]|nr:hypothetical protein [Polyangiaceae bacterium]